MAAYQQGSTMEQQIPTLPRHATSFLATAEATTTWDKHANTPSPNAVRGGAQATSAKWRWTTSRNHAQSAERLKV